MNKFYYFLLFVPLLVFPQEKQQGKYSIDAGYFYGNIVPHSQAIQHLITAHPEGIIVSFNRHTFGEKEWQYAYNYPDYGGSFHYQDMKNESLGEMYSLYGHYNFYFLRRHLVFRTGVGISYNTNPYDSETNFRNNAYGMSFMPSVYFMLNFQKRNLWKGLGLQAGFTFIHYSNGSLKAPNTSTNTFALNAGINYTLGKNENIHYLPVVPDSINYWHQPIKYNIAVRGGICESDVIGTGQYPYYALSFYADKRVGRKSAFQLGADFFWAKYLEEFIAFKARSFPEEGLDPDTDYRKAGIFAGHELFINNLSVEVQAGFYVYSPYKDTGGHYQRVGMKYYLSERVFSAVTLKSHGANAEVIEFALGVRL